MNKTKDERIRHALSGVNRRIVSIFRRVNVYDTEVENEFSVEVEFLREKDYATCRRFWVACNVSAEAALAIVLAVRAYVAEQFRVLSDDEKAAIRKRERRIRLAARKKKRKTTARVRSKKKTAPAPVLALDPAESTKAPAPAEAPKAEEKKPERKKKDRSKVRRGRGFEVSF